MVYNQAAAPIPTDPLRPAQCPAVPSSTQQYPTVRSIPQPETEVQQLAIEPESTMSGAAIMEDSIDAELTEEDAWDIVKDFIATDHTPSSAAAPAAPEAASSSRE